MLLFSGSDYDEKTLLLTSHRGILLYMKFPNCGLSIKQIEELIRFVTHDLRTSFVYFFMHSRFLIDGSFRLYMMNKVDFFQIPIYKFKTNEQKLHAQSCLMREFYLNNKYFMNGLRPSTVPTFLDHNASSNYVHRHIAHDIVSVDFNSTHTFSFPFETTHCYSMGEDILGTPISNDDDDDKILNVIKIISRIKRLQPKIEISSIYDCILSSYTEKEDTSYHQDRPFF